MTDAERIAQLEAALARALEEKAALLVTVQQQAHALAQSASIMRSAQAIEEKDAERRAAAADKKRVQRAEKERLLSLSRACPPIVPGTVPGQTAECPGTEPPPSPPLDGSPLPSIPSFSSPLSSPHPVSSPATVAVGDRQPALLVVSSGQPTKSQRVKRRETKPAEPRGDPRHQALIAGMEADYGELVRRPDADGGGPEKWDWEGKMAGREAGAISALLAKADADPRTAGDAAPAEVRRRWRHALADRFRRIRYAHVFVTHWGEYGSPRTGSEPVSAVAPTRAQEIWTGLQTLRRQSCEKRGLACPPEDASSAYLEKALAEWTGFPRGDGRFQVLIAAWEHYESETKWHSKGLPAKLFLSPGVLEVCVRKAREELDAEARDAGARAEGA